MPGINNTIQILGSLPDGYQEVLHWRVTENRSRLIILQILGLICFVIFGIIFSILAITLGKLPSISNFNTSVLVSVIVGSLMIMVFHELIHGLVMRRFGARPKYGILWKGLMFYATSPGYAYHRNNYIVIALAPFVVISILSVLGMWLLQGTVWVALLSIIGIINASGAIGDLWISMIVLRYPTTAYIIDERDGIRVFLPMP